MGRVGSGTWKRQNTKRIVDDALALEMSRFRKLLHAPNSGKLLHRSLSGDWYDMNFEVAWKDERRSLTLNYRNRTGDPNQTTILLQSTPLHFGGERWWFTCPMVNDEVACSRRVAILYLPPGERYYGCRGCHHLAYHSSQTAHMLERFCNPEARRKRWLAALKADERAREAYERVWPDEREWLASLAGGNQQPSGPSSV